MCGHMILVRQTSDGADRGGFRFGGTRCKERSVRTRIALWRSEQRRILGVNQQRTRRQYTGENREGTAKIGFGDVRELVDARRRQKTFESADASVNEWFEVIVITGHNPAPPCHVNMALPASGIALGVQSGNARRGRNA